MRTPPLDGIRVVCLAVNLPGPIAAMRLAALGAEVTKIEPPTGDPVVLASAEWYARLIAGIRVVRLDLKSADGIAAAHGLLHEADVLLTSYRPAALARLGLSWEEVSARHPRVSHVAIVGERGALADRPGHDLTYQAESGLLSGADMPRAPYADLAGGERAVSEVLAAVLDQHLHGRSSYREVALADVALDLAEAWRLGVCGPDGVLGGGLPVYGIYETSDGLIALAALEPHFQSRLAEVLGADLTRSALAARFSSRTSSQWAAWAQVNDLPLSIIQ